MVVVSAGNVLRFDELEADGTLYGVTTDERYTVAITPQVANTWHLSVMNRDGVEVHAEIGFFTLIRMIRKWATDTVNLIDRGLI